MQFNNSKPAAFIDRDGTLIDEVNFLSKVEELRIFPYTKKALSILKEKGFLIFVVTNQSGIGRNIYSEADMHDIHHAIKAELGDLIDAFYFCPHLPDEACACRKPNLGMLESAQRDFAVDLNGSWIIGDKQIDIETGFNAGIRTAMVRTGYGRSHEQIMERKPEIIEDDLESAVNEIIKIIED